MSRSPQRHAVLHELDPLTEHGRTDGPADDVATLLVLAAAHPRRQPASRRARPAPRRLAVALALALAGLAGGGVALAAADPWDDVAYGWRLITGDEPERAADAPQLVARGEGRVRNGSTELQLWVADTADGGLCAAVRAVGYSLDTCADGSEPSPARPLPSLGDEAFYVLVEVSDTTLYGRVDPDEVTSVSIAVPGRLLLTTPVDRRTGYWVTSLLGSSRDTGPIVLTFTDHSGRAVHAETVSP